MGGGRRRAAGGTLGWGSADGGGVPPVVGQSSEHRGYPGEHPARARQEGVRVLQHEDGGRVLGQLAQGVLQEVEGVHEVSLGSGAVQARVLHAREAPEGEVVGLGGERAVVSHVGGEVGAGHEGEVRVAGVHERPEVLIGLRTG